ncbi:MAG: B12-binding domain-containing radical SAM protein [Desulfamplus sp.]|nr:B12-binding domain-containing radical SAM protein [Desulfamplus sp.]
MTDILLIQPPIEDFYFTYKRSIPYGLVSIAASLLKAQFSVEIVDCLAVKRSKAIPIPPEMEYLLSYYKEPDMSSFSLFNEFKHYGYSYEYAGKIVKEKRAFLVGISSLFTPYWSCAQKMACVVKKFFPECKIVMGGHHPTALPEEVMKCSHVDFILRGEGEISMPILAQRLKLGESITDVPGIVFRKQKSDLKEAIDPQNLHISEPAWIEDFDKILPPAMELINHDFYSRGGKKGAVNIGSTVVVASRGCPMPCTYCSVGASSSYGRFRQRKVDDVINELSLQIEKYNIGFIDFEDENLTLNKKWFLELMGKIVRLSKDRNIEIRAMNGLYPPSLDEEMIVAMKDAGFKTLNLSLGSTSAIQLRRFRRPDVRGAFEQVLYIAAKHGLECVSYLIAGAPDQSPEDSLNDLLFLSQKQTLVGLSIFYPAPGSVDYEKCRQNALLPQQFSLMRSSALPISHTTSRIQAVTLLRLARIINFIKSLTDSGQPIPAPEKYEDIPLSSNLLSDRRSVGVCLLKWFLYDGVLRGVKKDGTLFEHNVDLELCRGFIKGLKLSN